MNKQTKIKSDVKRIKDPVIKERLLMVQASYNEPLRNVAKTFGYTHGKVDYWKKRSEKQHFSLEILAKPCQTCL